MNETQQLMRAVQALAQPAQVQRGLFGQCDYVGEELALDFEEALGEYMPLCGQALSTGQRLALGALDGELERFSGPPNEDFWLDPTYLETDPRWGGIRSLALAVLREFTWPNVPPDPSDVIYMFIDGSE